MKASLKSFTRIYSPPVGFSSGYILGIVETSEGCEIVKIDTSLEKKLKVGLKGAVIKRKVGSKEYNFFISEKPKKRIRVALITGSTRGIGREIALTLAKNKYIVIINSRKFDADAKGSIKALKKISQDSFYVQADVSKQQDVDKISTKVMKLFGYLDILINNAGITDNNLIENITDENWDNVISTNLKSVFICIKTLLPLMSNSYNGRIINMSSVIGHTGNRGQTSYAASKSAIFGLTKSLSKELSSYNISVNCIAPGFIETDMTKNLNPNIRQSLIAKIPAGHFGQPEDVAELVLFLCKEKSHYINGEIININGGLF